MRVETLTSSISAVPGTTVECRVRVVNDAPGPAALAIRVYGLADDDGRPVPGLPLPAGDTLDLVVPLVIPPAFADGEHALAIEIRSDRRGDRPVVAPLTLHIASLDKVLVRITPDVLRGRRRQRFVVDVENHRADTVDIALSGSGTALAVALSDDQIRLMRGEHIRLDGRLRGPRHLSGDPLQHILTIEGRGATAPSYATAAVTQRPLFATRLRGLMAGLALLALWLGAVGGAVYWWNQQGKQKTATEATATTVAGDEQTGTVPGDGTDTGTGTDGGTGDGTGTAGGGGAAGGDGDLPSDVADGAPVVTIVRGSVKAGATGANDNIAVTLTSLIPDESTAVTLTDSPTTPPAATGFGTLAHPPAAATAAQTPAAAAAVTGMPDGSSETAKYWGARAGGYTGGERLSGRLATLTVQSTNSQIDGTYQFQNVRLRRGYVISFSKAGFDTQTFQIDPTDDGKTIELDVELQPSKGSIGGQVTEVGGGALGDVALTISDGTLTFSTTSSTLASEAGGVGGWKVEGVSTPGTYTVVATRAGYGTQVRQVTLGLGETPGGIDFAMVKGVGSISGTVTGPGGPLGGVTLTASDGTVTRTTNSFTTGTPGGFLFPGLPVPGNYTITASADGVATQTQVVALTKANPNVTGIDFALKSTFAAITGIVKSVGASGTQVPLPNAGVELRLGDLKIRTTTAASGGFTLSSLPPGTYTITVSRYDHSTESRSITLAAGVPQDLAPFLLTYTPRQQLEATGSLDVSVSKNVNSATSPLDGVTLTLRDIANRITIANPPTGSVSGSYLFTAVPIGTYTLLAERDGYRPFSVGRITIGTDRVPLPITMLRFGQAFGQVVDGLSVTTPLNAYELLLYEQTPSGLQCKKLITIGNQAPVGGKIQWDVDTSVQLLNGDYVLRFRPAPGDTSSQCATGGRLPAGFADRPDANGNVGVFSVTDDDNPIDLGNMPVYPYPIVRGLVLAPQFANNAISFLDLDSLAAADLAIVLDCGTGKTATAVIQRAGNVASYTFDRAKVAGLFPSGPAPADGVLSACTVTATANGYRNVVAPLAAPLAIPGAAPYLDRIANIALVDFPDRLFGTVYWKDPFNQEPVFVGGVGISAPGAIVAFGAAEAGDPDGPGTPGPTAGDPPPTTANLTATADTGGIWGFPEPSQVFGTTTYTFTDPTIEQAAFDLTIDETHRVFTDGPGLAEPIVDPGTINGGSIDVVVKPKPGSLSGTVSIITNRVPQPFGDAVILATAPSAPHPVSSHSVDGNGSYTVAGEAGTWQLGLGTTATGNLYPAFGDVGASQRIPAGNSVVTAARQYVELGQVAAEFRNTTTSALVGQYTLANVNYPRITLTMQAGPTPYPAWNPATDGRAEVPTGTPGVATARLLPVSEQLPTTTTIGYQLHFELPGYDLDHSNWRLLDEAGTELAAGVGSSPDQVVQIAAGTRLRVELNANSFGTISGTVLGLDQPGTPGGHTTDLDLNAGLVVAIERLPDGETDCALAVDEGVTVDRTADPGFTASVRSGSYCVTYSHPDYVTVTKTFDVTPGGVTDASTDLNVAAGGFRLALETDETSHSPVAGALVRLFAENTAIGTIDTATVLYSANSDTTGVAAFDPAPLVNTGIIPGRYLVVVTHRATPSGPDLNFPVIATVQVPRGGATLDKRALMPLTGFSITGTVTAENVDHRPLVLPPFTVSRTYTTPQATGPDGLPNTATDADQQRLLDQTTRAFPAPTTSSQGYTFDELAVGPHVLHFTSGADYGFGTPGDVPVTVDGIPETDGSILPETAATAIYTADSVTVRVKLVGILGSGLHPGIGVSLDIPYGTSPNIPGTEDPNAHGTWVFNVVQPDISNYAIVVSANSYTATAADLTVNVPPSTTAILHDVHVSPFATLSGTATKQLTASTTGPVTEINSIELVDPSGAGTVLQRATPDGAGNYSFVVTSVQTLRVRAVVDNFITSTVNVPTYALGTANPVAVPAIKINQYASATVTVSGGAAAIAVVTSNPTTGVAVTQPSAGVYHLGHLIPGTAYSLTISATGYLTQTYPATGTFTPSIGSDQAVPITLELPKSISGTTKSGTTGVQSRVTLVKGSTVITGPVDTAADGTYTFTGLDYGSYTVRASAVGVGGGQLAGIGVNPNQAAPTAQDVPLGARQLTVHFNVTPAAAVSTAVITVNNAAGTAGQSSFTFSETGNLSYSVAAPGYFTTTTALAVTIPIDWNGTDTVQVTPPTLVEVPVTGTVTGTNGNFPAKVYLCADTVTTAATCATSAVFVTVNSAGGTFTFTPVKPNHYKLVAAKNSTYTPLVPIDVTDQGVTPTTITLAFA